MTSRRDRGETAGDVELHAWATQRGTVYQSAGGMVVVHGGVNHHRHEHHHSGGEESVRTTTPSTVEECPYPGLRAFGRDEAEWFFGREVLVSRIMNQLELCLTDHSPLVVVAPSGAGKSSLLRAGLLPELAKGQLPGSRRWPQLLLTPTADPLAALVSGLSRLTGSEEALVAEAMEAGPGSLSTLIRERLELPPEGRVVLVVDQLEELFTLCQDESVRSGFVDVLVGLAGTDEPVVLAVYGLRSDFYSSCTAYPHLRDALMNRQVIVGSMSDDEVRKAVTKPAARGGLSLAPGLVDVILRDLRGAAGPEEGAYEAGRLPLLGHALRATWLERRDNMLTVDSYRDTGGIDGAVAATAEEEFGKLSPSAQQATRLMFLGLIRIGENGEVTRRRRTRVDLLLAAADPEAVPDVAERFTRARLLTQSAEREDGVVTVEVTHEALLWAWPRLRQEWIGAGRSGVPVRQELEEAAVAWKHGGRNDATVLYKGAKLEVARTWASGASPEDLTPLVTAFLTASRRHQRRVRRIRHGAVTVVVVLALLASGLAVFGFVQKGNALEQRDNAIFDRVSAEADRQRETNGALAAQLDLVAYRMRPTAGLRTRLMTGTASVLSTPLPGQFGAYPSVAFGPDGRLATAGGKARFWDASDPVHPAPVTSPLSAGEGVNVGPVEYNARGDLLIQGGSDGSIRILDVSDAGHPVVLSDPVAVSEGQVVSLELSPDNRVLALGTRLETNGTSSGDVQLWDVSNPRRPQRLSTVVSVQRQTITSAAFSSDGATLAVSGGTGPGTDRRLLARLWDVSRPSLPKALGGELGGHKGVIHQVAFSPVGQVMATAGGDGKVLVWDVSDRQRPKVTATLFHSTTVDVVTFSPDGQLLATGDNSGSITLWNTGAAAQTRAIAPVLRGHTTVVSRLAFDTTGRTLASAGGDGKVLLWRLPPTLAVTNAGQGVGALAQSGDGRLLAVASGLQVTLWDVSDPSRLTRLGALPPFRTRVDALAIRPGKSGTTVLATGDSGGGVRLWDVSAPARPVEAGEALPGQTKPVSALAFDADGHTLVAASMNLQGGYVGGLRAWDVSDPLRPAALGDELSGQRWPVRGLAAVPRGGYIYSGDINGSVRAWRTADGTVPDLVERVASAQVVWSLAAGPNSRLIATGSGDSKIKLWDVSRPMSPKAIGKPLLSGGIVTGVGFAPDGKLLAGSNALGQIRLWDISDPAHAAVYGLPVTGHINSVAALRFSPHGGLLITGGEDGTVRLWQTDPARARAILCASTREAMSPALWKKYVSPDLAYDPPCGG
ncbi:hypothetical protein ABZ349_30025 [Streptomyces niveus]|uniref:nSTAND1 domain-containing NTPase n=1 Tax=Streptomyces niveus TaxID=193462 RepID=UPI0033F82DF4